MSIFGQWFALRFRGPKQRDHTNKKNAAHNHCCDAERLCNRVFFQYRTKFPHQPGCRSGEITHRVVTEADTGSAQPRGKKLWKIDRIPGKYTKLSKAHQRQHPIGLRGGMKRVEHESGDREAKNKCHEKCSAATP